MVEMVVGKLFEDPQNNLILNVLLEGVLFAVSVTILVSLIRTAAKLANKGVTPKWLEGAIGTGVLRLLRAFFGVGLVLIPGSQVSSLPWVLSIAIGLAVGEGSEPVYRWAKTGAKSIGAIVQRKALAKLAGEEVPAEGDADAGS